MYMAISAPDVPAQKDIVMLTYACIGRVLAAYGIVRPGRLRWVGPRLPRLTLGWQGLKQGMHPFRIRWGWVLLLVIILFLAMGEIRPAVSTIAVLP
jgi:hypothetical protein